MLSNPPTNWKYLFIISIATIIVITTIFACFLFYPSYETTPFSGTKKDNGTNSSFEMTIVDWKNKPIEEVILERIASDRSLSDIENLYYRTRTPSGIKRVINWYDITDSSLAGTWDRVIVCFDDPSQTNGEPTLMGIPTNIAVFSKTENRILFKVKSAYSLGEEHYKRDVDNDGMQEVIVSSSWYSNGPIYNHVTVNILDWNGKEFVNLAPNVFSELTNDPGVRFEDLDGDKVEELIIAPAFLTEDYRFSGLPVLSSNFQIFTLKNGEYIETARRDE